MHKLLHSLLALVMPAKRASWCVVSRQPQLRHTQIFLIFIWLAGMLKLACELSESLNRSHSHTQTVKVLLCLVASLITAHFMGGHNVGLGFDDDLEFHFQDIMDNSSIFRAGPLLIFCGESDGAPESVSYLCVCSTMHSEHSENLSVWSSQPTMPSSAMHCSLHVTGRSGLPMSSSSHSAHSS